MEGPEEFEQRLFNKQEKRLQPPSALGGHNRVRVILVPTMIPANILKTPDKKRVYNDTSPFHQDRWIYNVVNNNNGRVIDRRTAKGDFGSLTKFETATVIHMP